SFPQLSAVRIQRLLVSRKSRYAIIIANLPRGDVMAAPRLPRRYTPEEYLARERQAEYKSEYIAGQIAAMSGASRVHNRIVMNIARVLTNQTLDGPCETYGSDLRVKVSARGMYTYPDLVVVCGEQQFEDDRVDTLLNPTVIIEVLSPSTE